jgi:hypothetical protein
MTKASGVLAAPMVISQGSGKRGLENIAAKAEQS